MPRSRTALLTLLALVAAAACATALLPRIRDAMVGGLVELAIVATKARAGTMDVPTEVDGMATHVVQDAAEPLAGPVSGAGAPAPRPKAPQVGVVDIPEDRVARLTEKQLRSLRPANVVGADGSASGVRLHGVGALGVGLADGDVVTAIDGRPTPDVTTGMDAALRAWASGEAVAHATVLRAGRTLVVTVHIPKHLRLASGREPSAHARGEE